MICSLEQRCFPQHDLDCASFILLSLHNALPNEPPPLTTTILLGA